jgi:hypothetical protein
MKKGETIKIKLKCKDGKKRLLDCVIIFARHNETRQLDPRTFEPIGEWKKIMQLVVRWVDTDGTKRTDNISVPLK